MLSRQIRSSRGLANLLLPAILVGCQGGDITGGGPIPGSPDLAMTMTAPGDMTGMPPQDLSGTVPPDLYKAPDMTFVPPPDLIIPPDYSPPPDMAVPHIAVGSVILNEVHTSNLNGAKDEDGEQQDFLELYNTTNAPIDLSGVGLTNKGSSLYQWTFPDGAAIGAHAYLLVWASGKDRRVWGRPLHTNFNFNNGIDSVYLTSPGNLVLDSMEPLVRTKVDISLCRMPDIMGTFQHCAMPTPNAANAGTAYPQMLSEPSFSVPGGFYTTDQMVELTTLDQGAAIHYSLDGSDPTVMSPSYSTPIKVTNTTAMGKPFQANVIRAAAFENGKLSSPINSQTYFIDANDARKRYPTATINSIVSDPARWFGPNGIYTNFNGTAEAEGSLELYEPDGSLAFAAEEGNDISGNYSRNFPQKSFDITFRDAYYPNNVPNPNLYPNRKYKQLKHYRNRNTGNDFGHAEMRDAYVHLLVKNSQVDYCDFTPGVVFINGAYWGYMETREKPESSTLSSIYNLTSDLDLVVYDYTGLQTRSGDLIGYKTLLAYVANRPAQVQDFKLLSSFIDLENLAQYWGAEMFVNNGDWPTNNIRMWRTRTDDGRWRWMVFDMDFAFNLVGGVNDSRYGAIGNGPIGTLMANLLKNPQFKTLVVNAIADEVNSYFTPQAMTDLLTTMVGQLTPLMQDHLTRWNLMGGSVNNWLTGPIAQIKAFIAQREPIYITQTQNYFGLGNNPRYPITLDVNDTTMGNIKINTLDLSKYLTANVHPWVGKYFPNVPITVTAQPLPGFKFVSWAGADTSSNTTITLTPNAATMLTATFAADPNYKPPVKQVAPKPPAGSRNLGFGGIAKQSSTAGAYNPSLAVDGDRNGVLAGGSVTQTNMEANPWWQVDLGQSQDIFSVQLWNRTDANMEHLSDLYVFVSDVDMTGKTFGALVADNTITKVQMQGPVFTNRTALIQGKGRYVRVQLAGSDVLSLAEVIVLGTPAQTQVPDLTRTRNVALGKMAVLSSTAGASAAARAVDGNPSGVNAQNSVAATNTEANPYWEVDLMDSVPLEHMELINRTDCCMAALTNFTVYVSDQPMVGRKLSDLDADATVWKRTYADTVAFFTNIGLETKGRYVRVQSRGAMGQLNLAEVIIMGVPAR